MVAYLLVISGLLSVENFGTAKIAKPYAMFLYFLLLFFFYFYNVFYIHNIISNTGNYYRPDWFFKYIIVCNVDVDGEVTFIVGPLVTLSHHRIKCLLLPFGRIFILFQQSLHHHTHLGTC